MRFIPDLSFSHLFIVKIAFLRKIYSFLKSPAANMLIPFVGPNSNLSLSYIKGCHFIYKLFSIDSFLHWEGHHRGFWLPDHTCTANTQDYTVLNLLILILKACQQSSIKGIPRSPENKMPKKKEKYFQHIISATK